MRIHQCYQYICFVVILTVGLSCSSSKKLLQQGNYYQAVLAANSKLKKSPGNDKAQDALKLAYPLAIQHFKDEIHRVKVSRDPWKWSVTADAYQSMNYLYESIKATPKALQIIRKPLSFYKEYGEVKRKAAEEQYLAGEAALKQDNRERARDAFYFYQKADFYEPGYKDTQQKMAEAKDIATLRVVLEMDPVPSRFYKVSADAFYREVSTYVKNRSQQYEFIAFFTSDEAKRMRLVTDQIIRLRFEDFVVGQTNTVRNTETVTSEDSVKVGEVTIEGEKHAVYDVVTAKLTTTHMEVISNGILGMEIIDAYNQEILFRQDIAGEYVWFNEWATFNGDKRALNKDELKLCKQKTASPPAAQQLFIEFTKPIYSQFTNRLANFYKGYA